MKDVQEKNNNYWKHLSNTLHDSVTVFYESCYEDKTGDAKDANALDGKQLTAIIALMAEIKEACDSAGKIIKIEIEDEK